MRGPTDIALLWLMALAVVAAACTGSTAPTTLSTPASVPTSSTTPTTIPAAVTETVAPDTAADAFIAALNDGEISRALGGVAPDASFSFFDLELMLDEPLPQELDWLLVVFDLDAGAVGGDFLSIFLEVQAELRTERTIDNCQTEGTTVSCDYRSVDATSPIFGVEQEGEFSVTIEGGLISELSFDTREVESADRFADSDAFLRWALATEPSISFQDPESVDALLRLLDEWMAGGRPDVALPADVGDAPEAVATAWLEAREAGDWERAVALLGGDALASEFGSRDDFEANLLLEREIKLSECNVTLANERVGAVLACAVTVDDIITKAAGNRPINPNASSFQVKDGRVTELPTFIPVLAVGEQVLERWGADTYPSDYADACPRGIANPQGVEDRSCVQFLVDHLAEWEGLVRQAYE